MQYYECTITIELNPCREANSKKEFIENIIQEYNDKCYGLFEISEADLKFGKKND